MNAGELDQRVRLQRHSIEVDELGQSTNAWVTLGECWASVEPLQGREFIAAGAAQSEITARIRMRYRPGVTAAMRVLHGSATYNINAVIHVKSGHEELQLMCKVLA